VTEAHESLAADIPLPAAIEQLSRLFARHEAALFAVGGAIRDYLYHVFHDIGGQYEPKDVDLATEAHPERVVEILTGPDARSLGIRVFPKGQAFGVISALMEGTEYEIATFRDEWYDPDLGDGRRPDRVGFSTPGADARRRDLTINALFYDIQARQIRDYNLNGDGRGQGLLDIRSLAVRPVGDPRDRFREDKLRILRLVRFFSKYNPGRLLDRLDHHALAAIGEFRSLKGVSPERIGTEFLTGLRQARNPVCYLRNYDEAGLYPAVFPGLAVDIQDVDRIGDVRSARALLAWLLKGNSDPVRVRRQLNGLKYANEIADTVAFLLKLYRLDVSQVGPLLRYRDLYKQLPDAEERQRDWQQLSEDVRDFARVSGLEAELEHFLTYQPTVRAQDFLHLRGRAIGDAMNAAEAETYRRSLAK
jgi:tRNA nucleotidyltransferase/poly(A) polymerase